MKKVSIVALGLLSLGLMAVPFHSADAQVRPSPSPIVVKALPQFNCAATPSSNTAGTAWITKADAYAIDKTKDITVTVQTPTGKVVTGVCGASFTSNAAGTKVSAGWTMQPQTDKNFIYTCSAKQAETTAICNPPK